MKKPKVGQWIRVKYDDVGAVDGIYTGDGRFFPTSYYDEMSLNGAPIIKLGKMLTAVDSGLDK